MREATLIMGAIIAIAGCASILASNFKGKYFAFMRDFFAVIAMCVLIWVIMENIVFYW